MNGPQTNAAVWLCYVGRRMSRTALAPLPGYVKHMSHRATRGLRQLRIPDAGINVFLGRFRAG